MAAATTTGRGPGDSHGEAKPELHSGCGCGGQPVEEPNFVTPKRSCHSTVRTGGSVRLKTSSGSRIRVC